MKVLFMDTQSTPRRYGLLNKNCSVRHDMPPYELLVKETLRSSKQYRLLLLLLVTHCNYLIRSYC